MDHGACLLGGQFAILFLLAMFGSLALDRAQ